MPAETRKLTLEEALIVVKADKLASVTYRKGDVIVMTAKGIGIFPYAEWTMKNSQVKDDSDRR